MRVAIVSHRPSATNLGLVAQGWNGIAAELMSPREALLTLGHGDLALGRLDVRDEVDGVEEGLWALDRLAEGGVRVLNGSAALMAAHDKLLTARLLRRAALPHPRTVLIERHKDRPDLDFPTVLKPRFGSWGRDVMLCHDRGELERNLGVLAARPWFRRTGVLAQELIRPLGFDLRIVISNGKVVGAARRIAPPGEWRTNVSLGASSVETSPPPVALNLALAAAAASGLDLLGIDLLPTGPGGFCVIEFNAAVDFKAHYSLPGRDVFEDAMAALAGVHAGEVAETAAAVPS
jgi:[lysine-biosynthesis-protein LysW]--L-2-aminoadipate ligase